MRISRGAHQHRPQREDGGPLVAGDTLTSIAAALATDINSSAGADLIAITEGNVLLIVKRLGGTLSATFKITPALDNTSDLYQVDDTSASESTVELIGSPVVGEVWAIDLKNGSSIISTHSYIVALDDTLEVIAQELVNSINSSTAEDDADYTATVEGNGLVIVKRTADGDFSAELRVVPTAYAVAPDVPVPATDKAVIVTLNGTLVEGEVWQIVFGAGTHTYTVVAGDTLVDIVNALAVKINTEGAADYTATVEDGNLVIVNRNGPAPTTRTYKIAPDDTSDFAVDPRFEEKVTPTKTSIATLSETPAADQVWTVLLSVDDVTSQHGYKVSADDALLPMADVLNVIAKALAADINANAAVEFTAVAEGVSIVIVNRVGQTFTMENAGVSIGSDAVTIVELFSTPIAGEVWTVILDDGTFTTTHSYTVAEGESLADIARELAANINADSTGSITAMPEGDSLIIASRLGTSFVTAVDVTPLGNISIIETRKFNEAVVGNEYFYRPVNLNIRVAEEDQVDTLQVFHGNSPANDEATLTEDHLTGLGMGGDTVISGRILPGGIVYRDLEVLTIDLGSGNDSFTIESTHESTTNLNSGSGTDSIEVKTIAGHTNIDTGDDADTITVRSDVSPCVGRPDSRPADYRWRRGTAPEPGRYRLVTGPCH